MGLTLNNVAIILLAIYGSFKLGQYLLKTFGYIFMKPDKTDWLNTDEYKYKFAGLTEAEALKHLEKSEFVCNTEAEEAGTFYYARHWGYTHCYYVSKNGFKDIHEQVYRAGDNLLIPVEELNESK